MDLGRGSRLVSRWLAGIKEAQKTTFAYPLLEAPYHSIKQLELPGQMDPEELRCDGSDSQELEEVTVLGPRVVQVLGRRDENCKATAAHENPQQSLEVFSVPPW